MRSSGAQGEAMYRVGTGVFGLFVGFSLSLLFFGPLALARFLSLPLSELLLAGTAAGAICGVVIPELAVTALEGVIHLFSGMVAVILGAEISSSEQAPRWLRAAMWVGALYVPSFVLFLEVQSWLVK